MQMKIPYFKSEKFLELEENNIDDYEEWLEVQGFRKRELFTPYFHTNGGNFFFSIETFYNEKTHTCIVEYWNPYELLFRFASDDENLTFQIIKEFLCIAKDSSILEKNLKELYEND